MRHVPTPLGPFIISIGYMKCGNPFPSVGLAMGAMTSTYEDLRAIRACQDSQAEHLDMRFESIELMIIILSWMRGQPVDLYPGAPPSSGVSQLPTP